LTGRVHLHSAFMANSQDRLATAAVAVVRGPREATLGVRVNQLQRTDFRAVQRRREHQVRRRLRERDDLDQRAALQRDALAR
jgi:hypothetical protein